MNRLEKLSVWATLQVLVGISGAAFMAVAPALDMPFDVIVVEIALLLALALVTGQGIKTAFRIGKGETA